MSWKDSLQVRDLEPGQRLEMTCKKCGHVHYLTPELLMTKRAHENLSLAEVEQKTGCKARGCHGKMRMAMTHASETSGFVGGLA